MKRLRGWSEIVADRLAVSRSTGEDRGDSLLGRVRDGQGVAEPIRAPREGGEVGKTLRFDLPVWVEQRREGEFIKDD